MGNGTRRPGEARIYGGYYRIESEDDLQYVDARLLIEQAIKELEKGGVKNADKPAELPTKGD